MAKNAAPINDAAKPQTVSDQILDKFYGALEKKEEFKEIAARFRNESGRSDVTLRKVLFGDDT